MWRCTDKTLPLQMVFFASNVVQTLSSYTLLSVLFLIFEDIEVFPKWGRTFIDFSNFSEFRKFDKSLKHELGAI